MNYIFPILTGADGALLAGADGDDLTSGAPSAVSPEAPPKTNTVYISAVAITPADNAPIGPFMALYIGVAGNVAVVPRDSTSPITLTGVPAGAVIRQSFQGIQATGTTASGLVGLG